MRWVCLLVVLAGCDQLFLGSERLTPQELSLLPFGEPMAIESVNTVEEEDRPSLTDDLLELYFHRGSSMFVTRRRSADAPFGPPEKLTELDGGVASIRGCLAGNGLRLYFSRD